MTEGKNQPLQKAIAFGRVRQISIPEIPIERISMVLVVWLLYATLKGIVDNDCWVSVALSGG
jgi:hypothetical protein